jgi:vacuolar-type H+-ATPase subunit I/STV1
MAEEAKLGSASDKVGIALLEHADQLGERFEATRVALGEQIDHLKELQSWTVAAVQTMQQRVDNSIQKLAGERQKLEAERVRVQTVQATFELNTVQAIHDAVRKQSVEIERVTVQALGAPLHQIEQAAGQVRQNVKEANWLLMSFVLAVGIAIGLLGEFYMVGRTQNDMADRLDRIEQNQAVSVQNAPMSPAQQGTRHPVKTK